MYYDGTKESSRKNRLKQPANEHNQDYGPQHIIDTSNEEDCTHWFMEIPKKIFDDVYNGIHE